MVRPSVPSIYVASTNSTSPPAPVTARPVATPGTAVRSAASKKNLGTSEPAADVRSVDNRLGASTVDHSGSSTLQPLAASLVATLRSSLPSSRSSDLTPASRV